MNPRSATLIGLTAILMWSLLSVLTVATGKIPAFQLAAMTFGIGAACLAVAACVLLPSYYVNPRVGTAYVLVAFTVVVLGGMGSVPGAMIGTLPEATSVTSTMPLTPP